MGSKAKKPKKTSEEVAREQLQARQLDDEIGEGEQRFKALARNKLGAKSLLAGKGDASSSTASAAPTGFYKKVAKKKKKAAPAPDNGGGE